MHYNEYNTTLSLVSTLSSRLYIRIIIMQIQSQCNSVIIHYNNTIEPLSCEYFIIKTNAL